MHFTDQSAKEVGLRSWDESAEAWTTLVRNQPANRVGLLDPVMLELVGRCAPETIVDVGCGEGRFCRQLSSYTVGVDPTERLIEAAREHDLAGRYVKALGQHLPFRDASFDMAISYLVLIDIPDFRAAIMDMARVLRPGGHALVASINGFATTTEQGWVKDDAGNRLYIPIDNYNDEIEQVVEFQGVRIINYHRPLEAYMQAFLHAGFQLREFREPRPTAEALSKWPELESEERVPFFNIMLWQKG
jgi:SAM-dependent methyltransferase